MIVECHMIFVKNFTESSDENSNKNFIVFHFDFVIRNCCDDVNQNSYNIVEFYFFLF